MSAPTRHSWLPQCCSCRSGRSIVPSYFCYNQSTGRIVYAGPFGFARLRMRFFPGGDDMSWNWREENMFWKNLMTLWVQGKFLLPLLIASFILSDIYWVLINARHISWLFLLNFIKHIGWSPFFFLIWLLSVHIINRGLDILLHHQEVYFTMIKLCFK